MLKESPCCRFSNIALSKAKFIVGQNLGFDVNIMGAELHRMGIDSPMATMPVLDTCTEVTAKHYNYPVDVEEV
jgi:DNA polymerase-3 subunit alpha